LSVASGSVLTEERSAGIDLDLTGDELVLSLWRLSGNTSGSEPGRSNGARAGEVLLVGVVDMFTHSKIKRRSSSLVQVPASARMKSRSQVTLVELWMESLEAGRRYKECRLVQESDASGRKTVTAGITTCFNSLEGFCGLELRCNN